MVLQSSTTMNNLLSFFFLVPNERSLPYGWQTFSEPLPENNIFYYNNVTNISQKDLPKPESVYIHSLNVLNTHPSQENNTNNSNDQTSKSPKEPENSPMTQLKVFTQNVWFERFAQKERVSALCREIENYQPDIVLLQESTVSFFELLNQDSLTKSYIPTVYPQNKSYGVQILFHQSIFPFVKQIQTFILPSKMQREFLLCELQIQDFTVAIGTVHLESLENSKIRSQQLEEINQILDSYDYAIFGGDTNIEPGEDYILTKIPKFQDCWKRIFPNNPGLTYNSEKNHMIRSKQIWKTRYDRIYYKTKDHFLTPANIKIVSDQDTGVTVEGRSVWISDHFGLCGTFQVKLK